MAAYQKNSVRGYHDGDNGTAAVHCAEGSGQLLGLRRPRVAGHHPGAVCRLLLEVPTSAASSLMMRIAVLMVSAAINASTIPAAAADCTSNKDIDATQAHRATTRSRPANAVDNEKACRAYAASFYESVTLRQAAAGYADGGRALALLDSVINAFNDLLATKCGG